MHFIHKGSVSFSILSSLQLLLLRIMHFQIQNSHQILLFVKILTSPSGYNPIRCEARKKKKERKKTEK